MPGWRHFVIDFRDFSSFSWCNGCFFPLMSHIFWPRCNLLLRNTIAMADWFACFAGGVWHCCEGAPVVVVFVKPSSGTFPLCLVDASIMDAAPGLSLDTRPPSLPSKRVRSAVSSAPSSSSFAILAKKVVVALLGMCLTADGKSEISAARQQPSHIVLPLLSINRTVAPTEYTSVTCAKMPSTVLAWATKWRCKNPTRHWSIPSDTWYSAIALSSLPRLLRICTFRSRRTTSSSTSEQKHHVDNKIDHCCWLLCQQFQQWCQLGDKHSQPMCPSVLAFYTTTGRSIPWSPQYCVI